MLANLRNLAIAETRASTDALTGLPNSRSCRDNLKRMVAARRPLTIPVTAIMVDLDHFKQVNDRFGHGAGDDALAAVGDVLRSALRASDFAGRYGGEEFLILLPDTDHEGGLEAAEKVREAIQALDIAQVDGADHGQPGRGPFPGRRDGLRQPGAHGRPGALRRQGAGRNRVMLAMPEGSPLPERAGP